MRTLINATIKIDGTEVSNQANKVVVHKETAELDGTGFQSDFEQTEPGLKKAAVEMTLFQSFGDGSTNSLLSKIEEEGKPVLVTVTPQAGAVSATNPAFALMAGKMFGYDPINADGPGTLLTTDIAFKNVGQEGVKELVTPEEVEEAEEAGE